MSDLAAKMRDGARAERERLEAQLAEVERQLAIVATIEQLAAKLQDGDGAAGEAPVPGKPVLPPDTGRAAGSGGPGVSPARSVPKKRPAARQRPAQRTAAGPDRAPAARTRAAGEANRDAALAAIRAGCRTRAEIAAASGIPADSLRKYTRRLVEQGLIVAEGEKRKRRYRPAEPAVPKAPTVVAAPDRAPPASPPSDEIARRDREAVMGILRGQDGRGVSHGRLAGLTWLGRGRLTTVLISLRDAGLIHQDPRTRRWHAYEESDAA